MDNDDIEAMASVILVGLLANPNALTTSITDNVQEAFNYADEFVRQAKARNADSFAKSHGG